MKVTKSKTTLNPTQIGIAKELNISHMTVSKTLRNSSIVSAMTKNIMGETGIKMWYDGVKHEIGVFIHEV